jgi:hypothetical protein
MQPTTSSKINQVREEQKTPTAAYFENFIAQALEQANVANEVEEIPQETSRASVVEVETPIIITGKK